MDELLSRAIIKIKEKVLPPTEMRATHVPEPSHKQLYNILGIFDTPLMEDEEHVQFIYDFLTSDGSNPKDQIISIQTALGTTPVGDTFLNRVYRYCRLKDAASKTLQRYENLQREINALSYNR